MANLKAKLTAMTMAFITLTLSPLSAFKAAAEDTKGKYVSEVFIAYGKTEDDARKWLEDHGWEPVDGDFNKGKESDLDKDEKVATVMGIHRTNDPKEAVTDMAVMNMGIQGKEGYSFSSYKALLDIKRTEINEFLDCFTPVLQEYRTNVTGKGSASGKARADMAYQMLDKLYDGEPSKDTNDTGKPLGFLLRNLTRHEMSEADYQKDKSNHADLQQIILESSVAAVTAVEQTLAIASDTAETTWLERLSSISLNLMLKNPGMYVPEVRGQDLAPSAALAALQSKFGDGAKLLSSDYDTIQQELIWYESYLENNDLWQGDDESDEDYSARLDSFFQALKENNEEIYQTEQIQFANASALYSTLYAVPYPGEWGETLGDFFNPADGKLTYGADSNNFLPFVAALSEGQRAGLKLLPLYTLIQIGIGSKEAIEQTLPEMESLLGDEPAVSVYSGINRQIFRGGVALTSKALMQQNLRQDDPFGNLWDFSGAANIAIYSGAVMGVVSIGFGIAFLKWKPNVVLPDSGFLEAQKKVCNNCLTKAKDQLKDVWKQQGEAFKNQQQYYQSLREDGVIELTKEQNAVANGYQETLDNLDLAEKNVQKRVDLWEKKLSSTQSELDKIDDLENQAKQSAKYRSYFGTALMCIGGAIMIGTAVWKFIQYTKYFNRTFTPIPMMIVDEADIVSYVTDEKGKPVLDENGEQVKEIKFDQYVYYDVVRCNRQDKEIKGIGDPQDGVNHYTDETWGCGDACDLNGDYGKQWLALYTCKSPQKGNPILADSMVLQFKSNKQPEGTTKKLHFFCYDFAMNLADKAYCFDADAGSMYFFWDEDTKAFETKTASVFSGGALALTGIGGLAVGILGTTAVMMLKKKKEEKPEAPAAA